MTAKVHAKALTFPAVVCAALLALCGTAMAAPLQLLTAPPNPADDDGGTGFDAADQMVISDWAAVQSDVGVANVEVNRLNNGCGTAVDCAADLAIYDVEFANYQSDLVNLNAAEAADKASDAVPEPATLTLFGLGLAVLALSRRRPAR